MKIHIVKQGDTLYALSQKYGVPLQKIIEANPQLSNPDVLAIGDKVKIPTTSVQVPDNSEVYYKHKVKQGDSLWKLSKAWGVPLKEIIDANPQLKNPNVLAVGEVVNIPKKASTSPIQANYAPLNAEAKTQIGGKEYTGPKEQPAATPVPIPAPVPVPAPAPIPTPLPAPIPEAVALPNKQVENVPVQEMIHSETQSLFVQISVPAQEAVAYKEMPKTEYKQAVHAIKENAAPCENNAGYPGIAENPNFYDCPPAYPFYETAPNFVQPVAYGADCPPPYFYPVHNYPEPWYANAAPNYMAENAPVMNVSGDFSGYANPQYGGQSQNLPWPSCGCGGGMQNQPMQPYSYEAPVYNAYPVFADPNAFPVYGGGMPGAANQGFVPSAPWGAFGGADVANIPPYPQYPGTENQGHHNRVPGIQAPETFVQDASQTVKVDSTESTAEASPKSKESAAKSSAAKVKTSSQQSKSNKPGSKSRRSNPSGRTGTPKKRKNPWISD